MCGIYGLYTYNNETSFNIDRFRVALNKMQHRGPDNESYKQFDNSAILGHVRLSIIDLSSENNQPFQIDNRYWIVFNGEIYNYLELRDELISLGFVFRTNGDTEVLLRSYSVWGENCVKKFNGMWAFAIYDQVEKKLFCSRDRFGVKPFNFAYHDGVFIFASEIKSITSYFPELKKPNYNVIANFCRTSVGAQHRETWFDGIYRLMPAHNIVLKNGSVNEYRYWDYPFKTEPKISFNEAVEKYRKLFNEAVELRMRSDVPVGFTLSSGIDSSSIVSVLKGKFGTNKYTYTAAFSNTKFNPKEKVNFNSDISIDEPEIVKQLVNELDLRANIVTIDYENYIEKLTKIIYHLESGHGSPAIYPLDQILMVAKKDVKVVLEGQGADELLGGYISVVIAFRLIELLFNFRLKQFIKELMIFGQTYSFVTAFKLFIRVIDNNLIRKIALNFTGINKFFDGEIRKYKIINDSPYKSKGLFNLLSSNLYKAHTGGLVNLLHYGDAISMAHSIESRLPFMDYRLVEFVFGLPSDFKVYNGTGKYLHRESMKNIVPEFVRVNPVKFGFESPLMEIFKKDSAYIPTTILLSDKCKKRGLFTEKRIKQSIEGLLSGKKNESRILFRMIQVELWFQIFIDEVTDDN